MKKFITGLLNKKISIKNLDKSQRYTASKIAFTLAEVLITLTIIGVVAALTIPPIVNNYQKTQYVVGLKKAYTTMSQAFLMMMKDDGVDRFTDTNIYTIGQTDYWLEDGDGNSYVRETLPKYFKIAQFYEFDSVIPQYMTLASNESMWPDSMNFYVFSTLDGTLYYLHKCPICFMNGWTIWVDVNGTKVPNTIGRDVFEFFIKREDGRVIPIASQIGATFDGKYEESQYWNGSQKDQICSNSCWDCSGCAARIIEEGWKMTY